MSDCSLRGSDTRLNAAAGLVLGAWLARLIRASLMSRKDDLWKGSGTPKAAVLHARQKIINLWRQKRCASKQAAFFFLKILLWSSAQCKNIFWRLFGLWEGSRREEPAQEDSAFNLATLCQSWYQHKYNFDILPVQIWASEFVRMEFLLCGCVTSDQINGKQNARCFLLAINRILPQSFF